MNTSFTIDQCPHCQNYVEDPEFLCPHCGRFLVRFSRVSSSLFILAALLSVVVFRASDSFWPMYFLIATGIVHLYAVVFSRGAAIRSGTVALLAVSLSWTVWLIVDWAAQNEPIRPYVAPFWLIFQQLFEQWGFLLPLFIWLFGTVWALLLGRNRALPGIRLASSYFLATGAFIFGLWAAWAVLIQNSHFQDLVLDLAVIFALIVPLVLLLFLLEREPPKGTKSQVFAVWSLLLTAYLFSTQFLTALVEYGLGVVLPKVLGLPTLGVNLPWLLEFLKWRAPLSGIILALALMSLAASSLAQAIEEFRQSETDRFDEMVQGIRNRLASSSNYIERFTLHLAGALTELAVVGTKIAIVAGATATNLVENIISVMLKGWYYGIKMLRFLVVPVFSFSALSILLIMVLKDYRAYVGGANLAPESLWGEAVTYLILVLVFCAACFGFAPAMQSRFVFSGTKAAATFGMLIFFVISIASLGLIFISYGFRTVGIALPPVQPGPIYLLNIAACIVWGILLAITVAPVNILDDLRKRFERFDIVLFSFRLAVLVGFGLIAIFFGYSLMAQNLQSIAK